MDIQVRYSDRSISYLTLDDDIELLLFIVGGTPKAVPYDTGRVLVYSEDANKRHPNVTYKGRQLYGAIALMQEADYARITGSRP